MKKNYILRVLFAAVIAFAVSAPLYAVTEREMEEARTIAAKAYLRYANNGSGYLDDVKATNLNELQSSLKAKEKENIKAFLAIPIPKDYPSWDREKLVEFWAVTAMKADGLIADGKLAKHRIRKQIGAMKISAPTAAPAQEAPAVAPAQDSAAEVSTIQTEADSLVATETDILADQKALEADHETPSLESASNNTWIYVVILVILIAVVIWLVVYAAKVMKRQQLADGENGVTDADIAELRERAKRTISQHKETIDRLTKQLQEVEEKVLMAREEASRYKEDNRRLNDRIAELQDRLRNAAAAAPAAAPKPQPKPAPRQSDDILHVIYLGRANSRGIFVRADRSYSNGNTVYRLNTEDGLTGTFEYVDNPVMNRNAMEHPKEILSGGCTADDIEDTIGATSIVTESRGTAIFENGYWKVLRKSRIRFK